jgi:hypothetical protein
MQEKNIKYPRQLMIELSRICNLHCKECYHENKEGIIDLVTFGTIIKNIDEEYKKAGQDLPVLCPWFLSEPMMTINLNDYLILASSYGYKINLTTNGTISARWENLIIPEINYHIIVMSIDGATKKTYLEIRETDIRDPLRTLEIICRLKKERNLSFPICMKLTKKDIEWAECLDFIKFHFKNPHVKIVSISQAFDDSDGFDVSRYDCKYLSDFFIIQHDLTIAPCCMRLKAISEGVGKLDIDHPMESFFSEERKILREGLFSDRPLKYCLGCRSAYTGETLGGFVNGISLRFDGPVGFKKDFYNMFFFNPNWKEN